MVEPSNSGFYIKQRQPGWLAPEVPPIELALPNQNLHIP